MRMYLMEFAARGSTRPAAVLDALKDYREEIQRQTEQIKRNPVEFGRRRPTHGALEFLRQRRRGPRWLPGSFAASRRNRRTGVAGTVAGDIELDACRGDAAP